MGDASKIQWTDHTWNPWQGCAKVSPGCDSCYMFRDKKRYGQDPSTVVRSKPPTFNRPRRWNREAKEAGEQRLVFTCSWSDWFIRDADEWRSDAWAMVRECDHLVFQILTKRPSRIVRCLPDDWGDGYPNVWLGVSAEDSLAWARRVPILRGVPAAVRFVSYEPALGPLDNCLVRGLDWVIVGGESGGREARPFEIEWAERAVRMCREGGVPCFVKQLGSNAKAGQAGRLPLVDRAGGDMSEWPERLRVREYPA